MCDYSLMQVQSRPAAVGDRLRTTNFGTGTRGFASIDDPDTVVCLLPGTELAFDDGVLVVGRPETDRLSNVAIFRQINKEQPHMHHDALEFPAEGATHLLTYLVGGQRATVLQLPAVPKSKAEAQEQKRVEFVG